MSAQTLNSMLAEYHYMNRDDMGEDENGEYEWIEREDFEGNIQKVKMYKHGKI